MWLATSCDRRADPVGRFSTFGPNASHSLVQHRLSQLDECFWCKLQNVVDEELKRGLVMTSRQALVRPRLGATLKGQLRRMKLSATQMPVSQEQWFSLLHRIEGNYLRIERRNLRSRVLEESVSDQLGEANQLLSREREALMSAVRERGLELKQAREFSGAGSFRLDLNGGLITISEILSKLLQLNASVTVLSFEEFLDFYLLADRERFNELLLQAAREQFDGEIDLCAQTQSGDLVFLSCKIRSELDRTGAVKRIQGLVRDVTEQHMSSIKIQHLAYFDELTGLANRTQFLEALDRTVEARSDTTKQFAVAIIDMDGFKEINDSFGHDAGDMLLREIGDRMRTMFRDDDLVARFGGDEFVVLLPNFKPGKKNDKLVERWLVEIARPFTVDGCEIRVSASIGMSFFPSDAESGKELLKRADSARYLAKARGRNRWAAFEPVISKDGRERLQRLKDIRDGIERHEFVPYFQPIVNGSTGEILAVEALARWKHPTLGLLGPHEFIDLAEQQGLIDGIGDLMLYTSARQMQLWLAQGFDLSYVSVNVTPSQLINPLFIDNVKQVLSIYALAPARLQLEITETTVMKEREKGLAALNQLAAIGVRLAMDDFGTGYSSLAALQEYPVGVLKLDRSFVSPIKHRHQAAPLVSAVVAIAATYGMELVAEGVETAIQRDCLLAHGYRVMQGYFYFKPMSAHALQSHLQAQFDDQNCSVSTSACAATV
jgi:diguanylate cyclase (GGDEF)-like protein